MAIRTDGRPGFLKRRAPLPSVDSIPAPRTADRELPGAAAPADPPSGERLQDTREAHSVGDGFDDVPGIADLRHRTIVIDRLSPGDDGAIPDPTYTVNGQFQPEIDIQPGEIQRWRIANAEPDRAMWLHVEGHTLHQIGQDGFPFTLLRPVTSIMLSPGNRAEFLIRATRSGRYRVHAESYDQGHPGGARPAVELATMVVSGRPVVSRLPRQLDEGPQMPIGPVVRSRTLHFGRDTPGGKWAATRITVDGRELDADWFHHEVTAGTVEEWTLINDDVFQHPIHTHVNPFQVVDVQGIPAGDPSWQTDPDIWWDTYRIPSNGQLTIRMYFRPDVTGKTVYHCRILPHEDNGMIGTLLIQPPADTGEPLPGSSPPRQAPRESRSSRRALSISTATAGSDGST
ncbi:multicopper oxidase family protein [Phytoactinopolyspora endophytica]|uniref:multicopper oxidase family protein n=1 Tax=Phytoactinopolyspora endophytica TaxID=1642495 RepID=UPI00101D56BD|nr:multicopper oxidase domain-containing protein [Phytoactinopolyspora endophytica]